MSNKKSLSRTFRGMNYRKFQRKNSRNRQQLTKVFNSGNRYNTVATSQ